MLEPIKKTVTPKNLRKVTQNEEIRKMGARPTAPRFTLVGSS